MRIAVTAEGAGLDAPASPVFGRCPCYIFVDTDTLQWEAAENPARGAPGGAGIQAAQFIVERGARAVVTGQVGPNAMGVFQAAGVSAYLFVGGTVRAAVAAFQAGTLAPAQAGGQGRGKGGGGARVVPPVPASTAGPSREETLTRLRETAETLRRQLADLTEQIDRLQQE